MSLREIFAGIVFGIVILPSIAVASFDDALDHYQKKEFPEARKEFLRLAEIGNHHAQFNLGAMYLRGEGGERDLVQAYVWMALAAQESRDPWIEARDLVYGKLSADQKVQADADKEKLFDRLSDAVLARDLAPSLASYDSNFVRARVKKRSLPEYPWEMRREGLGGVVEVEFGIGRDGTTMLHGILLSTNIAFSEAAVRALKKWQFEPARLNGKPVEEYGLRQRFNFQLEGAVVDERRVKSLIDELKAKAQEGKPDDEYKYAYTLEAISSFASLPKDAGNPNTWFWKAAAGGHAGAQFSLGNNLLYGNACTAEPAKGIRWLEKSAEAGQPEAQYVLAIDMLSGARLAPDRNGAMIWLRRSAESDFSAARLKMAWLLVTNPDEHLRDPKLAEGFLQKIPEKFIDTKSLKEVQAAAAAAAGDFEKAVRLQKEVLDEASRNELPDTVLQQQMRAYKSNTVWTEAI